MLPWMEGPAKRVWVDGGHWQAACVSKDMKGQIISVLIGQWLVVIFRCESMSEGFVNSQIHTHTHTYTQITNYTKISLMGVCVQACVYHREDAVRSSHLHVKKMQKKKKVEVNNHFVKKVLLESVEYVNFCFIVFKMTPPVLPPPLHPVCAPLRFCVFRCVCVFVQSSQTPGWRKKALNSSHITNTTLCLPCSTTALWKCVCAL